MELLSRERICSSDFLLFSLDMKPSYYGAFSPEKEFFPRELAPSEKGTKMNILEVHQGCHGQGKISGK